MIKLKGLLIFFTLKNLFLPPVFIKEGGFKVAVNGYKIYKVGQMPDTIRESSAVAIAKKDLSFWTLGDGGCKSELYEINKKGGVLSVLSLKPLKNFDWEEMTKDDAGNIYIGDFGNNSNKRENLMIFKINVHDQNRIDTIRYSYVDQKKFPPPRKEMNFDCEAMFWHKDSLYLFSKNRGKRGVKMYRLPDKGGSYVAPIHHVYDIRDMITSAAISPDKKLVALLSYGKIYFLNIFDESKFHPHPWFVRLFNRGGQSEACVFTNNTDLFITNEDGQLFEVRKEK